MKKYCALLWLSLFGFAGAVQSQAVAPLKLLQKIPMPNVQGRLDHSAVDLKGMRLFVAALGDNQNTVEVVDLKAGRRVASIPGQSKPQGVFYSPALAKLFVANGTDGTCKIFDAKTLKLMDSLAIGTDADHVGYDPATKYLYVGVGDAKSGALSVIDTRTNKHVEDIKTDARPGGIKFDKSGTQIFITLAGATNLGIVDRKKRQQVATWPVTGVQGNVALALDDKDHRLFAGSRTPPMLTIFDTASGKQVSQVEGIAGIDDLWYDARNHRVYASGGRGTDVGFVYIYQQKSADQYELISKIPTAASAGTSLWVPELNRLYVAAPANDKEDAAVLVFEPQQ
ncbi:MAG: YncE family protein [Acidobacteriia bacterium]|nr:YncE family protein [Terriglobia bacterium]